MDRCQETQSNHPGCRCESWPDGRASFSGADCQGKFGDVGDYGTGPAAEAA